MTRSELIQALARRFPRLVGKDADMSVSIILQAITDALKKGHRIEIRGFGSFRLNYRPPRTARNPMNGDSVDVPGKYVPHFKAGRQLAEQVNQADRQT